MQENDSAALGDGLSPEDRKRGHEMSWASRRKDKIAKLIETAPPFTEGQVRELVGALALHPVREMSSRRKRAS
jgi:hypothetical protein